MNGTDDETHFGQTTMDEAAEDNGLTTRQHRQKAQERLREALNCLKEAGKLLAQTDTAKTKAN